ncbi:flagellar protein FlaG [Saccharophagus degradans]|uniref:Flagellar protein FlaG protein n=1 Tax=Saccharophagus degradans (strain 2-40 / ATCC 43961 / DSM 17024) TaxID=203122 RepID=Q21IM0_SACD2|nr:flagellar protein FlaG [Saccharophagus degradans]ABD81459.1 flagellar protein FlaG protein [Saccharophagus degradans 2-40]
MTEVRSVLPVGQLMAGSASSRGTTDAQVKVSGKELPLQPESLDQTDDNLNSEAVSKVPSETIETAVTNVNDFIQSVNRNLQFTVDEDSERTVIKVLDGTSGELIRQIPEDIFLELARRLRQDGELQLLNVRS